MDDLATDRPSYPEYEQLVELAKTSVRADGGFVDPVKMREADQLLYNRDWAVSILGHSRLGMGRGGITLEEMHLLLIAARRNITAPLPERIAAARAKAEAAEQAWQASYRKWQQDLDTEWAALSAALTGQNMQMAVVHNFQSARHCEGFVQGADHLLPQVPIHKGRFARLCYQALCETRSNAHNLYFPHRSGEGDNRRPTCKACIRRACKLTGLEAPTMLGAPHSTHGRWSPPRNEVKA